MLEDAIKLPEKGLEVAVRYVVLHHTGVEPEHYDLLLLLPGEDKLATWRIPAAPETWAANPPAARRIADHRIAYLEFEGEISGGRGKVKRVAAGEGLLSGSDGGICLLRSVLDPFGTLALPVTGEGAHQTTSMG